MQVDDASDHLHYDDDTIDESITSKRTVQFDAEIPEKPQMTLKLMTNGSKSKHESIYAFTELINRIKAHFSSELTIESNMGVRIKTKKVLEVEKFEKYFELHQLQTRTAKSSKTIYITTLTIKTNMVLRIIKRQNVIAKFLHQQQIFLKHHPWKHHEWNTVSLGWLLKRHPNRERATDISCRLIRKMIDGLKVSEKDIPKFQLVPSTQNYKTPNASIITTSCYEIHCLREEKPKLEKLLSNLHSKTPTYVKFKLKYEDPSMYEKLIMIQNDYLHKFRSVKLTGITAQMMFYLTDTFSKISGVTSITEPWNSSESGKWFLNTDMQNFRSVGTTLTNNLDDWVKTLVPPDALPSTSQLDIYPVTVHFKDTADNSKDDDSISMQTYISHTKTYISEMFTNIDPDETQPESHQSTPSVIQINTRKTPPPNPISTRSWSSIVNSTSDNDTSDLTSSTIVTPTNNYFTHNHGSGGENQHSAPLSNSERNEYESLKQEITDLRNEMRRLKTHAAYQTQSDTKTPETTSHTHDTSFQRMEQQYQKMNDMFAQQQEFLILCMDQMLHVRPLPSQESSKTQSSHTHESAMAQFKQKTKQAMRIFSTSSNGAMTSLQSAASTNNTSQFRRPNDTTKTNSRSSKDTKRSQSIANITDSRSYSSDSPQSKRHDVKSTPPPRNEKSVIPISNDSTHSPSVTTPVNQTPPIGPRVFTPTKSPDYGIDAAMEEALANFPSPIPDRGSQSAYINPRETNNTEDPLPQPKRLSLEKVTSNK